MDNVNRTPRTPLVAVLYSHRVVNVCHTQPSGALSARTSRRVWLTAQFCTILPNRAQLGSKRTKPQPLAPSP